MTNKNRHGVDQHDEKEKEAIEKQFRKENRYEFYITTATLMIAIALFLIALYNNTTFFSMLLAVYALIVTVGFELMEWIKYIVHNSSKKCSFFIQALLKYYSLVLFFASISFVIILSVIYILSSSFFENMCSQAPNILTILSLIGYFFSYTTRSYLQKKKEFIRKYNWYNTHLK